MLLKGDQAKLTDFGLTQSADSRPTSTKGDSTLGPVRWSAPEALSSGEFSMASDVYMFASALVELYSERIPFAGLDDTQVAVAVMGGSRPDIPAATPQKVAEIIARCWHSDPRQRPSMIDVANELGYLVGDANADDVFDADWDPRWIVRKRDLEFVKELGKGQYGTVWEGRWKQSRVAIKEARDLPFHEKQSGSHADPLADLRKEARLMLSLRNHSNCVTTYGVCLDDKLLYMIIEFCGLGASDSFFGKGTLTWTHKVRLLRDAALGLQHLHDEGLVHRDVAARNILIADGWVAKMSDFGMARMYDIASNQGFTNSNVGPLRWMAPESIYERKYSPQSDIWMFGCTLLEVATEQPPWINADKMLEVPGLMKALQLPTIPGDVPEPLRNLILHCLQYDAAARPGMSVIAAALTQYLETLPLVNFSTN